MASYARVCGALAISSAMQSARRESVYNEAAVSCCVKAGTDGDRVSLNKACYRPQDQAFMSIAGFAEVGIHASQIFV